MYSGYSKTKGIVNDDDGPATTIQQCMMISLKRKEENIWIFMGNWKMFFLSFLSSSLFPFSLLFSLSLSKKKIIFISTPIIPHSYFLLPQTLLTHLLSQGKKRIKSFFGFCVWSSRFRGLLLCPLREASYKIYKYSHRHHQHLQKKHI